MNLTMIGSLLVFIGIIIIITGVFLLLFGGKEEGKVEGGFVGFIGPIPIGFGTDRGIMMFLLVLAIVIMLVFMFLGK